MKTIIWMLLQQRRQFHRGENDRRITQGTDVPRAQRSYPLKRRSPIYSRKYPAART